MAISAGLILRLPLKKGSSVRLVTRVGISPCWRIAVFAKAALAALSSPFTLWPWRFFASYLKRCVLTAFVFFAILLLSRVHTVNFFYTSNTLHYLLQGGAL